MFSFVKNALFGTSSSSTKRDEIAELKRENEEIKGLLRELLTNKRKRDRDEENTEDGEERNKRVHVEAPVTSTSDILPTTLPSTSSFSAPILPSSTPSSPATSSPSSSSSVTPAPTPSPPPIPTPTPALSTPSPSSFVVSAGGAVDLNNSNTNTNTNTNTTQSNNPTTDSNNPTTTDSNNPTTDSNNTTTTDSNNNNNNTTTTTINDALPAKKDVMISFNCRTMTQFAEQLTEALEKTNKFEVFCCTKTIKLGEVYRVQISSAAQKASLFICLLNAGWADSKETLSEYLLVESRINRGKGGAIFPIVFLSDNNTWMDKSTVDWIMSKYQGYFIKKEDTADPTTWQAHIDKCVGQLCQENF